MNKTLEIIIDAHLHLPVSPLSPEEKRAALLAEMKANGVSRGVVISDSEPESAIGSLGECAELFADCADIAVVGGISPYFGYTAQLTLADRMLAEGLLSGIKLFCGHEPIYLTDDNLDRVYTLAEKYDVPLLFHSGWDAPQYAAPQIIRQAAQAHPAVKFVCCHCCYPQLGECFRTLADCGNVHFDLSSVAEGNRGEFIPIIEAAVRAMPERVIFGSDFGSCDQAEHLRFARLLNLSPRERELLFRGNAERLYRL